MMRRERGATFLGTVVILLILGAAVYAGIRLVPIYLEHTKVARALEQVRDENASVDTNAQQLRLALERRWDVEDIKRLHWKDVKIERKGQAYDVTAAYDAVEPFIGNVYLLVRFEKTVTIQQ